MIARRMADSPDRSTPHCRHSPRLERVTLGAGEASGRTHTGMSINTPSGPKRDH
jgi:hypothetical protein